MKICVAVLFYFSGLSILAGQQFINGGLEGVIANTATGAPRGWTNVPYDDPICEADVAGRDTPNLTGHDQPDAYHGICGDPHSGNTFISGVRSINPGDDFPEGIMQQVDSLVPGQEYTIIFWQAVVKQQNLRDKTGSWAVYIDSVLAGVSKISRSNLAYNSNNLNWEKCTIDFVATKDSHWIKFLPVDDDSDVYSDKDDYAGLRMGIDDISLSGTSGINVQFTVSPVSGIIIVDNKSGEKLVLRVLSADGNAAMRVEDIAKHESSIDLSALAPGTYTLEFVLGKKFCRFEFVR